MVDLISLPEEHIYYKKFTQKEWSVMPGSLAGSSQPGRGDSAEDLKKLDALRKGKSADELDLEDIMRDLNFLYKKGTRVIYCLASNNRNPDLIKYLWQKQFNNTIYITDIGNISIEIEDFNPPTMKQLDAITEDAVRRIKDGQNIVVHCVGGKGRTGTILTAIYMNIFKIYDADKAIKYIRANYLFEAVETDTQIESLKLYAKNIGGKDE